MKKNLLIKSNLLMALFIVICFIGVIYTDSNAYQKLVEEHMENVVQMGSVEVSNEIERMMSNQLTASRSIAKNTMLCEWMEQEPERLQDENFMQQLYEYLSVYQDNSQYATVFCVSEATGNYYYQDGLNKTIHPEDAHDSWYYNFVNSEADYDIQVDADQANDNIPTIFVNYRLTKQDGTFLGVVGVAKELTDIQEVIDQYEEEYGVSVYLINRGGSKNSFTQKTDHFISTDTLGLPEEFLNSKTEEGKQLWFTEQNMRTCVVNTYSPTLMWNVIAIKNADSLLQIFINRLSQNLMIVIGMLVVCISVTIFIFQQYDRQIVILENMDELTGLVNRKLFERFYSKNLKKEKHLKKCMFMMDIDNFKCFNDSNGHLYGNMILSMVGECLRTCIEGDGLVARWGGDEFIGILNCSIEDGERLLKDVMQKLGNAQECCVTLSIGITELQEDDSLQKAMKKADEAMYHAKQQGKNRICRFL